MTPEQKLARWPVRVNPEYTGKWWFCRVYTDAESWKLVIARSRKALIQAVVSKVCDADAGIKVDDQIWEGTACLPPRSLCLEHAEREYKSCVDGFRWYVGSMCASVHGYSRLEQEQLPPGVTRCPGGHDDEGLPSRQEPHSEECAYTFILTNASELYDAHGEEHDQMPAAGTSPLPLDWTPETTLRVVRDGWGQDGIVIREAVHFSSHSYFFFTGESHPVPTEIQVMLEAIVKTPAAKQKQEAEEKAERDRYNEERNQELYEKLFGNNTP